MSEEEDTDSELCPICDQWCGTEAAKQIAEWEASIIQKLDELEELRKYKEDNEKTLANYRAIAEKWSVPPVRGGRMIGDTSDE